MNMQASKLLLRALALVRRRVSSDRLPSDRVPRKPKTRSAKMPTTGAAHAAMEFSKDLEGEQQQQQKQKDELFDCGHGDQQKGSNRMHSSGADFT